jgi:hypothetical protein
VKGILERPEMTLANDIHRLALLLEFLALAIDSGEKKQHTSHYESDTNANSATDMYVDKAVTYIQSNFANVKINDVARNIGINRLLSDQDFQSKKWAFHPRNS